MLLEDLLYTLLRPLFRLRYRFLANDELKRIVEVSPPGPRCAAALDLMQERGWTYSRLMRLWHGFPLTPNRHWVRPVLMDQCHYFDESDTTALCGVFMMAGTIDLARADDSYGNCEKCRQLKAQLDGV